MQRKIATWIRKVHSALLEFYDASSQPGSGSSVLEMLLAIDWTSVSRAVGLLALVLGVLAFGDPINWAHFLLAIGVLCFLGPGVLRSFVQQGPEIHSAGDLSTRLRLQSGLPQSRPIRTEAMNDLGRVNEPLTEGWQFGLESLKDIEWELRDNEARYRDLLDSQTDIIIRQKQDGTLIFVNQAFSRTFAITADAVIGRSFTPDVIENGEEEEIEHAAQVEPFGAAPLRRRFTQLLSTAVGPRWFAWEEQSIRSGETGALETQRIGRDITEQRQVEETLNEARRAAETASEAKSRFLAVMSHEIRTPLGGIMGMTGLLEGTRLTAEQTTYATAVKDSAKSLLGIIDEILDFSKIEAGKITFEQQPFDLNLLLQGIAELLAPRAWDKNLELAWDIAPDLPQTVIGDEPRVRQILMNLVGNAVKFTSEGGIRLSVRRADVDTSSIQPTSTTLDACSPENNFPYATTAIAFSVTDTGIGLSKEQQERIFTEFEQADTTTTRRFGGTGLGLTISRRLARSMNGDITICTRSDHKDLSSEKLQNSAPTGAVFELTLPFGIPDETQDLRTGWVAAEHALSNAPRRVLIAGAHLIEAQAISDTLASLGHHVRVTSTEDAVAVFRRENASGTAFNVIICDTSVHSGIRRKLCSLLDNTAGTVLPRALVIIEPTDRERLSAFREEGFSAYLMRPVRPSSLLSQLVGTSTASSRSAEPCLTTSRGRKGMEQEMARSACAKRVNQHATITDHNVAQSETQSSTTRVLLAEDNPVNALLATRILQDMGHTVVHVENGSEAVEAIAQSGIEAQGAFDIVLMDLHMPELDGIAACKQIHIDHASSDTDGKGRSIIPPIIALTANAFAEDRRRCLEAGMSDFVTKPFDREHLARVIEAWCHGATVETGDGSLADVG